MARRERTGSNVSRMTAVPPPKRVPMSNSVWPPTWDAGKLTSTRAPRSESKNAALRHMHWQVMLRCESRAGLGDPVDPVVKMTSAPSEGEMEQVSGGSKVSEISRGKEKNDRDPSMQSAGGENCTRCCTVGQFFWTARPSSRKSATGVAPRKAKAFAPSVWMLRMTSPGVRRRSSGARITPNLKQANSRKMCSVKNGSEVAK